MGMRSDLLSVFSSTHLRLLFSVGGSLGLRFARISAQPRAWRPSSAGNYPATVTSGDLLPFVLIPLNQQRFESPAVALVYPPRRALVTAANWATPKAFASNVAAWRSSMISAAMMSGSGRFALSSRLSSFNQKMSRLNPPVCSPVGRIRRGVSRVGGRSCFRCFYKICLSSSGMTGLARIAALIEANMFAGRSRW